MAYLRSLSTRATLIARANSPSVSYIPQYHDGKQNSHDETLSRQKNHNFIQPRFFGSCFNDSYGSGGLFPGKRISQFVLAPSAGSAYCRYMSSVVGEGSENTESIMDVAEVLKDTTIQAVANQAPAVNEVAVAAADSFLPVAVMQHFIDIVHNFTGFNWWASIVVTTLLIRSAALPLLFVEPKAKKKLRLLRPHLKEIIQQVQDKGIDANSEKQMQLVKEFWNWRFGVTLFAPMIFRCLVGISFFLAILNMADKVPSFKNGGAFWFTDLSGPDSFYILPILTVLTFLINTECQQQYFLKGSPDAGLVKNTSRILAALSVPLIMIFPQAICCYLITSNLFSFVLFGLGFKAPGVRKFLGIPQRHVTPPK